MHKFLFNSCVQKRTKYFRTQTGSKEAKFEHTETTGLPLKQEVCEEFCIVT
jgi:hypothetical protein